VKIVFINRFFFPDESATSQMLSDLVFELANSEDHIEVLTSRLLYGNEERLSSSEVINGVHIKRVWTTSFGRSNLFKRAFDYFSFYISAFFTLLFRMKNVDIVVAKTDPPLISVVAAIACKIKGCKAINWVQDLFPEVATSLGISSIARIEKQLVSIRNASLKAAMMNVVIGEKMKERLLSLGVDESKIYVIDNWADGSDISPVPKDSNDLRKRWEFGDELVVGYSGNMGRAHDFDAILSAAEYLKVNKNIRFLFIGEGAKKPWLESQVAERQLDNVIFKPYQARSQLTYSLCVPDIHLISLYPELEGLIVPSKYYGIIAAGRPVVFLGSRHGEIARMLNNGNCGRVFELGEWKQLADYLKYLSENHREIIEMGERARSSFISNYDRSILANKWKSLLHVN